MGDAPTIFDSISKHRFKDVVGGFILHSGKCFIPRVPEVLQLFPARIIAFDFDVHEIG
jgi:hypothetical protein